MFENKTEREAKNEILDMVSAYYSKYHNIKVPFKEGDRIPYASRVYDEDEFVNDIFLLCFYNPYVARWCSPLLF